MKRKSVLERAFELAVAGPASSITEICRALKAEGYADAVPQTSYPAIRKQLRAKMEQCRVGEGADGAKKPETNDWRITSEHLTSCVGIAECGIKPVARERGERNLGASLKA